MKKVKCEYCGAVFDPNGRTNCPNCGGVLADQGCAEIREPEVTGIRVTSGGARFAAVAAVAVAVFAVTSVLMTAVFRRIMASERDYGFYEDSVSDEYVVKEEAKSQYASVGFGETAEVQELTLVCDAVRDYREDWYEKGKTKVLALHLVITNTSEGDFYLSGIEASYGKDGLSFQLKAHSPNSGERENKLDSGWLRAGKSVEGWVFFEIPKGVDNIELEYGGRITVTIPEISAVKTQ